MPNTEPQALQKKLKSKFKRLSLKTRLVLAATAWLSAMTLAAGVSIPGLVKNYLVDDLKRQMSLSMDEIIANLDTNEQGELSLSAKISDPRYSRPYSGFYWSITDETQTIRSRSLWDKVITQSDSKLNPRYLGAREEKLVTISKSIYLPGSRDPVTILVGQEEAPIDKTLEQLTNQIWVILSLMVAGILVLVATQISWSLRPLGKMQKELKHLRSGERDLLDEHYPKEVAPLVTDLNALIFHYQELLERARNHAGNLSHALKTPLSVIRNELDHLSEQDRAKIEPSLRQIQEYIDYHLSRARMAGSMNILSVKSCPSERVDAISIAFDKVFAERDIALINEIDPDLKIAIEQTDLDEMLGNLLENAYKWSESLIRVHTNQSESGLVAIVIEDDGPGIPESKLKEVLKRGVRLDETTPGTGLGLNIVNEMAYSYRSELTLESSQLGGLKATLIARVASD